MKLPEVIDSSRKKAGWDNYCKNIGTLLSSPESTAQELRKIHYFIASPAVNEFNNDSIEIISRDLHTLDRPDGKQKTDEVYSIYEENKDRFDSQHPYQTFTELKAIFRGLCEPDTQIKVNIAIA